MKEKMSKKKYGLAKTKRASQALVQLRRREGKFIFIIMESKSFFMVFLDAHAKIEYNKTVNDATNPCRTVLSLHIYLSLKRAPNLHCGLETDPTLAPIPTPSFLFLWADAANFHCFIMIITLFSFPYLPPLFLYGLEEEDIYRT